MAVLPTFAGRHILFLNWRDLSNPAAGGAETYAEEMASRFARAGARVTIRTAHYEGAAAYEWDHRYLVVRDGGRTGVYLSAGLHLRRFGRGYDAVVDFQNGIPFFAPFWAPAGTPVVCVMHHVHQRQFDMYFHWPMNAIGRLLEGPVTRMVYRRHPFVAVSGSTRAEMRRELGLREPIHIVPNGIGIPQPGGTRSPEPSIAVVTRLVPHKQLHLLVEAVPALLRRWPGLHVDIAGTGPARDQLRAEVHALGLGSHVALPGHVSEQTRNGLLSRAWLTVAPSLAEGWGLTVLEAAAFGTPAVAHDVPGLRDSVRPGETGWLVRPGPDLAPALMQALGELSADGQQQRIAASCRRWARRFSWDASAERLARVVASEIRRHEVGSPCRRRAADLATVASFDSAGAVESRQHGLRTTDTVISGPSGAQVLLTGCDELGALRALERLALRPSRLRLATSTEILCGEPQDGPV